MLTEIAETLKRAENESTESPWWMVIDPHLVRQRIEGASEYGEVPDHERVANDIAFSVEGPFFSREDAESYLKARKYAYSEHAIAWCASGYRSQKYRRFYRELVSKGKSESPPSPKPLEGGIRVRETCAKGEGMAK